MKDISFLSFGFVFFLLASGLQAQGVALDREITIRNDNDVYTARDSDKYYSNGLIFNYRWSTEPGRYLVPNAFNDSSKIFIETVLAHKFYTPKFLENEEVENFDRPYSGSLTAAYFINYFKNPYTKWRYGMDLTLVGPATGAGAFQEWYHELFGFPTPKGWGFQIPNELTINLQGEFQRQFVLVDSWLDLMATTTASLGTGFTNAKQMLEFRLGTLTALNRSPFSNALLGESKEDIRQQFYFLAGIGMEYVVQNITIQGSIWNDEAPHVENIVPWVRHMRFGFVTSAPKVTFKVLYNWLGPEVKQVGWHSYVGLELNIRFVSQENRK